MNKTCDRCGIEIPNSAHRSMSDIDTYWCDDCETEGPEPLADLMQRLADREALGVEPRPDNPVLEWQADENGDLFRINDWRQRESRPVQITLEWVGDGWADDSGRHWCAPENHASCDACVSSEA